MRNCELVIIGAGPAGITAAVYAARKRVDFCIISRDIGGQAAWSASIENYTGYQFITGPDLAEKFRQHAEQYKFDVQEGEEVVKVEEESGKFKVTTDLGNEITTKTLIIASGKVPRKLGVPGEEKYNNKGVAYCSTCDGPLFANKDVAVVGGGNSALDAALQMGKIASKVHLLNINKELTGDAVMRAKVISNPKIEVINSAKTKEIIGDKFVKGITYEVNGKTMELSVSAVFVEIGMQPNTGFIDLVEKNAKNEININCSAETSHPGIYAAGDATSVQAKQIIIAAGDGAKAAMGVFKYLSTH